MKNALTALQIKRAENGKLFDGGGLSLIKKGESGKWVYRYSHLAKRREMGLGTWPTVSLADARRSRDEWETHLAAGRDPIEVRADLRADAAAERDKEDPTLAEAVRMVFDSRKASYRGAGAQGRWLSPITNHIIPKLGQKRLSELHQKDLRDTLLPIWESLHPTADRSLKRIRIVLRECQLMGYPCDPFVADAAQRMLGEVRRIAKPIPATPWQDIPTLYASLPSSVAGDCLRLLILTCVRMAAARGAKADEFAGNVWTVPAERVKGREGKARDFRVPLSKEAQRVVARSAEYAGDFLFTSHTGRPITDAAVEKALRTLGEAGRPHGFRTSFRSWVQDTEACSYEVAETVLGHAIGNRIERSYARSDLLDRRQIVMESWARFVTGAESDLVNR